MSSREIADLVEKRHDNVKRTIEMLVDRGVIASPQIEEKATAGRPAAIYHLGKRDTLVVVAQLSPEFTARVVDRWQELEAARGTPAILPGPQLLAAALIEANATLQAQSQQIEAMRDDVEALDRIARADVRRLHLARGWACRDGGTAPGLPGMMRWACPAPPMGRQAPPPFGRFFLGGQAQRVAGYRRNILVRARFARTLSLCLGRWALGLTRNGVCAILSRPPMSMPAGKTARGIQKFTEVFWIHRTYFEGLAYDRTRKDHHLTRPRTRPVHRGRTRSTGD